MNDLFCRIKINVYTNFTIFFSGQHTYTFDRDLFYDIFETNIDVFDGLDVQLKEIVDLKKQLWKSASWF